MPDVPVERIATDPLEFKPEAGTALCLSGGGYRAMLFHVGVLWRLYEARLLQDVQRLSSVSGGSITAAVLGLKWQRLSFDPGRLKDDFVAEVVAPVRALGEETIDKDAIVSGIVLPGRVCPGLRQVPVSRRNPPGSAGHAAVCDQRDQRPIGRALALYETVHARLPGGRGEGPDDPACASRRRVVGVSAGALVVRDAAR